MSATGSTEWRGKLGQLRPRQLIRAPNKEVRAWLLEIGDLTECYMYMGVMYTVKWKQVGLGLTEVWLEEKKYDHD